MAGDFLTLDVLQLDRRQNAGFKTGEPFVAAVVDLAWVDGFEFVDGAAGAVLLGLYIFETSILVGPRRALDSQWTGVHCPLSCTSCCF